MANRGHEQQPREPSAASFIREWSKNVVAIRIEDDGSWIGMTFRADWSEGIPG